MELTLQEGPLSQRLDLSPLGLADRSKPIELTFRAAKGFRGRAPGRLRWRVSPEGLVRTRILFPGNAFLGIFGFPRAVLQCSGASMPVWKERSGGGSRMF